MRFFVFLCLMAVVSCGEPVGDGAAQATVPRITSTDFVLMPCAGAQSTQACTLLMAGGKRILIGAPEGTSAGLTAEDLQNLDAVLLLSLRGADIEGLGAIRNATWRAGRAQQLLVAGPIGIEDVSEGLNTVYEVSDAFAYVEGQAHGGYDVAVLNPIQAEGRVFDTGDLKIDAREDASGYVGYDVNYNDIHAVILPCGHAANTHVENLAGDYFLACHESAAKWPVSEVVFIGGYK